MAEAAPVDEIAALLRKDAAEREINTSAARASRLEKDSKLVLDHVKKCISDGRWEWGVGVCMIKWSLFGEDPLVSLTTRLDNLRKKFPETSFGWTTIDLSCDLDTNQLVEAVCVTAREGPGTVASENF